MNRTPLPTPAPNAIEAMRLANKHSVVEACAIVHADRKNWYKWRTKGMPLAEWELYLIKTGMRKP